jgi:hypothetical protein
MPFWKGDGSCRGAGMLSFMVLYEPSPNARKTPSRPPEGSSLRPKSSNERVGPGSTGWLLGRPNAPLPLPFMCGERSGGALKARKLCADSLGGCDDLNISSRLESDAKRS